MDNRQKSVRSRVCDLRLGTGAHDAVSFLFRFQQAFIGRYHVFSCIYQRHTKSLIRGILRRITFGGRLFVAYPDSRLASSLSPPCAIREFSAPVEISFNASAHRNEARHDVAPRHDDLFFSRAFGWYENQYSFKLLISVFLLSLDKVISKRWSIAATHDFSRIVVRRDLE